MQPQQPQWGPPSPPQPWTPPPTPPHNPAKLLAVAAVAGMCVVCMVVGAFLPKQPETTTPQAGNATAPAHAREPSSPPHETAADAATEPSGAPDATPSEALPDGVHRVGDTWSLGECTYHVSRVYAAGRLGDRYLNETASEGAVFVVAHYTERNNGHETLITAGDNVVLRDHEGRSFSPSSRAQMMLHADLLPELQPGVQHEHRVGFEVPTEITAGPFDLVFTERGLLGSDTVTVRVIPASAPPVVAPEEVTGRSRHRRHR